MIATMAAKPTEWLTLVLIGFSLILIVEGLAYALFPHGVKALITRVITVPDSALRSGGLVAAISGIGLIWLMRL